MLLSFYHRITQNHKNNRFLFPHFPRCALSSSMLCDMVKATYQKRSDSLWTRRNTCRLSPTFPTRPAPPASRMKSSLPRAAMPPV
ncbi:MAG: hypothetical protein EOM69_03680 [Clostridia bacterium]|nr:hypothetical protein [Clostridia bacterium]